MLPLECSAKTSCIEKGLKNEVDYNYSVLYHFILFFFCCFLPSFSPSYFICHFPSAKSPYHMTANIESEDMMCPETHEATLFKMLVILRHITALKRTNFPLVHT